MARFRDSLVRSTRSLDSSSTSPTRNVKFVSPWTPPMKAVMSMFRMSPSWTTVLSGMPWQITSFSDEHRDFGKPR
ncbi:hypothetical protein D9M68_964030 [compost metagenome]